MSHGENRDARNDATAGEGNHHAIDGDRLDIIRDRDHPGPDADVIRPLIERRPTCGAPVVQP